MRERKISKYSMTCDTVVSMSSESVIVLRLRRRPRRTTFWLAKLTRSWMSKVVRVGVAHAALVHVGLVAQDQRRGDVADGSPYSSSWLPIAAMTSAYSSTGMPMWLQHVARDQRRGDAVVEPRDGVADVVQVAGDGGQLGLALG